MGNLIETATWDAGVPYFAADAILTGGPNCPDNIPIQALANRTAFLKKQIDDAVSGALTMMYASKLKTARTITMTGDGSWVVTFDGSGNVTAAMTLTNTGVTAGTYPVVTIDGKGRVTAARALQSADLPANAALSGAPTAPTAAPGTNTLQIANTAYVQAAIAALVASSPAALDTLNELATALGNDPNFATTMTNALAAKAPLASPALTGTPTAPTAASGANTSQIANMIALHAAIQTSGPTCTNAAGTADAITASYVPAIAALSGGMTLSVRASSANATTAPTFTPNSGNIPAKAIVKGAGSPLVAGDISGAGHWLDLRYDQTLDKWVLLNPATGLVASGSGKIIASIFTATRSSLSVSGDTTVMSLNFSLAASTPVVVDWRSWFGAGTSSLVYGNARLMLGATAKSRSPRMHLGYAGAGHVYCDAFVGSTYLGVLAAGSYTVSIIWNNETSTAATFNPGAIEGWSQSDSEIIVRAAY